MSDTYDGRSLLYVAKLLGHTRSGWPSCRAFIDAHVKTMRSGESPALGDVAWYDTSTHGNCALGAGGGLVLAWHGKPRLYRWDDPLLGTFVGTHSLTKT